MMKNSTARSTLIHPTCSCCGAGLSPAWTYCGACGARQSGSRLRSRERSLAGMVLAGALASGLLLGLQRPAPKVPEAALALAPPPAIEPAPPSQPAMPLQLNINVPANQWIDTGVYLQRGESVHVTASGEWNPWKNVSPDLDAAGLNESLAPADSQLARTREGRLSDRQCSTANWGALVERVGGSTYLSGGDDASLVSRVPGELYLGINDDSSGNGDGDNTGSLMVTITGRVTVTGAAHSIPIPARVD